MVGGQGFDAGCRVHADEGVLAVRCVAPADHGRVVVERVDHLGAEVRVAVEEGERPRHRHVVPQSLRPVSLLLDRDVVPQPWPVVVQHPAVVLVPHVQHLAQSVLDGERLQALVDGHRPGQSGERGRDVDRRGARSEENISVDAGPGDSCPQVTGTRANAVPGGEVVQPDLVAERRDVQVERLATAAGQQPLQRGRERPLSGAQRVLGQHVQQPRPLPLGVGRSSGGGSEGRHSD